MALQLASVGERVKAFMPALLGLTARVRATSAAHKHSVSHSEAERATAPPPVPIFVLSPEAQAALAPLDLPPDGPMDSDAPFRASLPPDAAARNFVSWARALDLVGHYSRRSIYLLYCEFSEVDEREPLGPTHFLEALEKAEGIAKVQPVIDGRVRRSWQWTIEPAKKVQVVQERVAPVVLPEPVPVPAVLIVPPAAAIPEPPAILLAPRKLAKPIIVLPRFVPDADHPFSPAGLREGEKNARRLRLNARASRKQRGALRRAA
jgi:hypothetical protein